MTPLQAIRYAVSIHKYPRYLVDAGVRYWMPRVWRRRGVSLGNGISWLGCPILSMAEGSVLSIGDGCVICSRSTQTALGVNHPVILRTLLPGARLSIGSRVRMSGTTVCAANRVVIGDRCVIGANVTIADTDFHSLDPELRSSPQDALLAARSPVEIGDDVFIGGGSTILKGVRIGSRAVIGAASVVTRDVPEGAIVAGNAARQIGALPLGKISTDNDTHGAPCR